MVEKEATSMVAAEETSVMTDEAKLMIATCEATFMVATEATLTVTISMAELKPL